MDLWNREELVVLVTSFRRQTKLLRWNGCVFAWIGLCFFLGIGLSFAAPPKVFFQHTPPAKALLGQPFLVLGVITENDDLDEVLLYYRIQGEKAFRVGKMTLFQGEKFKFTIPAKFMRGKALEYYVVGVDVDKKRLALYGLAQNPRRVPIVNEDKNVSTRSGVSKTKGNVGPTGRSKNERNGSKPVGSKKPSETSDNKDSDVDPVPENTVFSAARKQQQIQNAPAVMTVVTEQDIKAAGYRDLIELLRYVVGIDINQNGLSPDFGMRGLNPRLGFGDKLLLMIDGHNMSWRQLNRNSNLISIDMIKQVEIIRGPGSTLWGAGALSGVINIITKSSQDLKGFHSVLGGSPLSRSYFLTLQGGKEIVDGLSFRASFSLQQDNWGPLLAPIKEFLRDGVNYSPHLYEERNQYFYSRLSWKGLSFSFYQSRYSGILPMSSFSTVGGDDSYLTGNRYIAKLSFLRPLGDWGTLLLWASYDYYGFGPESRYESNPLSPLPSSSTADGNAGTFGLYEVGAKGVEFKGYYPSCQLLPGGQTPCVDVDAAKRTCTLRKAPKQDKLGVYKLGAPSKDNLKACAPIYQGGNFLRRIRGFDHRFEAGVQLNAQITDGLSLNVGMDFEYLNVYQLYSPEISDLLGLPDTNRTNVHFSAFAQLQYNFRGWIEITGGARVDYDQGYGFFATPRAAVVITPGYGTFAKILYGRAFKAPSFLDLYYYRKNASYGNPELRPEAVHTFELQVGWFNKKSVALSANGYVSYFTDFISYVEKKGKDKFVGANQFPTGQTPDAGIASYEQKENVADLLNYGGEFEVRLFPMKGLNFRASFGIFGGEEQGSTLPNLSALDFAARWTGSLSASYRYNFVQISGGALFVGPKTVPKKAFQLPGFLPKDGVHDNSSKAGCTGADRQKGSLACAAPNWSLDDDPTTETPMYVQSYLTVQFIRILGHLDLVFRLSNVLNLDIYDAADDLFIPQKRLDFNVWMRIHF